MIQPKNPSRTSSKQQYPYAPIYNNILSQLVPNPILTDFSLIFGFFSLRARH